MPLNIIRQDITRMKTDAIVAADGHRLKYHGWVGGAIADAAGEEYQKACEELGFCDTGDVKITKGYNLPAKYVIHTVGPEYRDGHMGERVLLKSCYEKSLRLAKEYGCKSIAFPVIATGGYGFPKDEGLRIAAYTIQEFLVENDMEVYLVTFDRETAYLSKKLDFEIKEYIDDNYVGEENVDLDGLKSKRNFYRNNGEHDYDNALADRSSVQRKPANSIRVTESDADVSFESWQRRHSLVSVLKIRDESFQQMLFRLIVEKDMKNSTVYTRANISKSHFSKIKSNPDYKPKKETVFALAVALRLNIYETKELMMKAGYAVSHSFVLDTIVEYFIVNRIYRITDINIALFEYDQPLLGEKPL